MCYVCAAIRSRDGVQLVMKIFDQRNPLPNLEICEGVFNLALAHADVPIMDYLIMQEQRNPFATLSYEVVWNLVNGMDPPYRQNVTAYLRKFPGAHGQGLLEAMAQAEPSSKHKKRSVAALEDSKRREDEDRERLLSQYNSGQQNARREFERDRKKMVAEGENALRIERETAHEALAEEQKKTGAIEARYLSQLSNIEGLNLQLEEEKVNLYRQLHEMKMENDNQQTTVTGLQIELDETKKLVKTKQEFLNQLLISEVENGNLTEVEMVIHLGASASNSFDHDGKSAIFIAIEKDYRPIAERLLIEKADISVRSNQGECILDRVVKEKNIERTQYVVAQFPLIDSDARHLFSAYESADENDQENRQFIANQLLYQGTKQGNLALMRKAFEKGADPRASDTYESVLHMACRLSQIDAVNYLLERGACPAQLNRFDQTPAQVTLDDEIKQIIHAHESSAAIKIQSIARGFFAKREKTKTLEIYKKIADTESPAVTAQLMTERNYSLVIELSKALDEKRWRDAVQIIWDNPVSPATTSDPCDTSPSKRIA